MASFKNASFRLSRKAVVSREVVFDLNVREFWKFAGACEFQEGMEILRSSRSLGPCLPRRFTFIQAGAFVGIDRKSGKSLILREQENPDRQ
jgi:hypothetical protein